MAASEGTGRAGRPPLIGIIVIGTLLSTRMTNRYLVYKH
jgi:hypothetical protein